ncbi:MAG: nuclear transport factor 2 family protein [Planctomycetota bacterium]
MDAAPHRLALLIAPVLLLGLGCAAPTSRTQPSAEAPGAALPAPAEAPVEAPPAEQEDQATAAPQAERGPGRPTLRREAHRVIDEWHQAAAVGDRARYLGHFSPDAVFLGTDATERWDLATFRTYVEEHFRPGSGWTYTPSDRHVEIGPNETIAWFDEKLTSNKYGGLRGTGALRRDGDTWKIAHYSMTFTVPNDVARSVVDIVRAGAE